MSLRFDPDLHIRNVDGVPDVALVDSRGRTLPGILGVIGAGAQIQDGTAVGTDRIVMQPGSAFELHTHPGAHILYVLQSHGFIHVDGVKYEIARGDTVFVPADFAHGVEAAPVGGEPLEILAFGVPHMHLGSTHRMTLVED